MSRNQRSSRAIDVQQRRKQLEEQIAAGSYYEALQGYCTATRRLISSGQTGDALLLVSSGAQQLLSRGRHSEAVELLNQAVALCDSGDQLARTLCGLLEPYVMTRDHADALFEKPIEAAVKRSQSLFTAAHPSTEELLRIDYPGDPALHALLAVILARRADMPAAAVHFVRSNRRDAFIGAAIGWLTSPTTAVTSSSSSSSSSSSELFFARVVLDYCSIGDLAGANAFSAGLIDAGAVAKSSPLVQFVGQLLRVLERDALQMFVQLERYYSPVYQHDATIKKHLNAIAWVYFASKRAPKASGLGSLVQSMFGGGGGAGFP